MKFIRNKSQLLLLAEILFARSGMLGRGGYTTRTRISNESLALTCQVHTRITCVFWDIVPYVFAFF